MCLSSKIAIPGLSPGSLSQLTTLPPNTKPSFKIESDTWLRTMLVFYSLNARLNHLAGQWPEENWMAHLPESVKNLTLTQLSIPGSHNSFAYKLDVDGPLAPDLPQSIRIIAEILTKLVPTSKIIIHNWSKTQQLTFVEQLRAGVRYFDCRIGYHSQSKRIRFLHGLWGNVVEDELKKLPAFLDSHPGEVVILDFNHDYAMNAQDHAHMAALLLRVLGDYLIPFRHYSVNGSIDLSNLTLFNLNQQPKQQVIIAYNNFHVIKLTNHTLWPGLMVQSIWPETTSVTGMVRELVEAHDYRHHMLANVTEGRPMDYFFVYQGILTPDGDAIASNLLGSLYDSVVPSGTATFVNWLASKRNNREGTLNICIVDGVETFNFLPTVVAMNIY